MDQSGIAPLIVSGHSAMEPLQNASIDRILHAVREHLGAEIAFVSRYVEGDQKELTHVSSDLTLPMGPGFRDSREDSYCWHVLEGRLPELIQDPADHPFTKTMALTEFLPVGCHLNTPLKLSDGSVYGSFCCLSRTPDRSMTQRDMGTLRAFAALAVEQIERTIGEERRCSTLGTAIGRVLDEGSLAIVYQPIVALADGSPVGVECLARFPDAQYRGPDKWFAEACEIGRGVELEMLAVRRALDTLGHVPTNFYVSINASPETILSGELEKVLDRQDGKRLVIEVTEHQRVDDFAALKAALARLKGLARIAIDDVGAGYAGLRFIVDLEPDLLKLDMSLTRDIDHDPARRALTTAMVRLAQDIGCKIVAEGIESIAERDALAEIGVEYGQGYLFAQPMPLVAAQQYLIGAGRADAPSKKDQPATTRRVA